MSDVQKNKPAPLMTRSEVEEFTTLGRSTIYEMMNPESDSYDSSFPTPVRIGRKRVAWVRNEVAAWIKNRIEFHRVDFTKDDMESLA